MLGCLCLLMYNKAHSLFVLDRAEHRYHSNYKKKVVLSGLMLLVINNINSELRNLQ